MVISGRRIGKLLFSLSNTGIQEWTAKIKSSFSDQLSVGLETVFQMKKSKPEFWRFRFNLGHLFFIMYWMRTGNTFKQAYYQNASELSGAVMGSIVGELRSGSGIGTFHAMRSIYTLVYMGISEEQRQDISDDSSCLTNADHNGFGRYEFAFFWPEKKKSNLQPCASLYLAKNNCKKKMGIILNCSCILDYWLCGEYQTQE